jgi:hypothetical protein
MQERQSACRPVASATARVACKQVAACTTNEAGRRSREVGRQRRQAPPGMYALWSMSCRTLPS